MSKELQQIEYFISLLIESDVPLDLSNADDDRVQAYHAHKISMETLKQLAEQRADLLAACKEAERVIRWAAQESKGRVKAKIVGGLIHHADHFKQAIAKAEGGAK